MKSDKLYLSHLLQSIQKILDYTEGLKFEQSSSNRMAIDAVIRNFEIIGEATKKVSNLTTEKHQEIPWKKMAGLRDKLIHDYIRVDLEIVWDVIVDVLPSQQKDLKRIFSDFT